MRGSDFSLDFIVFDFSLDFTDDIFNLIFDLVERYLDDVKKSDEADSGGPSATTSTPPTLQKQQAEQLN